MINYIISFILFVIYIFVVNLVRDKNSINIIFALVGVLGLIVHNLVMSMPCLEYFFLLITIFSLYDIVKIHKKKQ